MTEVYEIAIIGAGVVGCATARRFARAGAKVVLIEKGPDILSGASKANSAILHTGFDAPPDSTELALVQAGRAEYLALHGRFNLPLLEIGALVCAWTRAEAQQLEAIAAQGRANGVERLTLLTAAQARALEPGLAPHLVAALHVAEEGIIDPWSAPLAYVRDAMACGAKVLRNCEVTAGRFDGHWSLTTSTGPVKADAVINAAGLFGDELDQRLGFAPAFSIRPRKGEFVVLDKAATRHVRSIILPVPNEITKGIVVCPTVFGNVLIGPTATEQQDRQRAGVTQDTLQMLHEHGARLVPALAQMPVAAVYAGLRPASEEKDYRIYHRPQSRALTLGGIRSTGLSAALGLAQHAFRLMSAALPAARRIPPDHGIRMPNLCEALPRRWQEPGRSEIVCHCEMVTEAEITEALDGPLSPGSFAGLKRQTRVGMGRCQGFYCTARLAALTRDRFSSPLAIEPGASS